MTRLHPLSAVTSAVGMGMVGIMIPPMLVGVLVLVFEVGSFGLAMSTAPLGFAAGAAYGVTYYYRFEYELTEDTCDVSSGVFSRRSREIPYHRIQNVDVTQSVIQRLLGLATVNVETAGGGNTEAALNFVSDAEAQRLQREIRRRTSRAKERRVKTRRQRRSEEAIPTSRAESPPVYSESSVGKEPDGIAGRPTNGDLTDEAVATKSEPRMDHPPLDPRDIPRLETGMPETPTTNTFDTTPGQSLEPDDWDEPVSKPRRLFSLSSKELLLYSFTSIRPAAVAGVLFFLFIFTDQIIEYLLVVAGPVGGPPDIETGTTGSYAILTIVSLVNGIIVTYLLSVAYTFTTYYGFRLGRAEDDFVYERGLLQRYSGSIPAEKVQSVTVTDNPLQRLIKYAGLWVETAGYGPDSGGGSQSAVPLAQEGRVHRFTERLMDLGRPTFSSPPPLARRRYLVRYSLVAGSVVAGFYGLSMVTGFERWYFSLLVFLGVPPAAHLRYVHIGYYVGADHLVIRRGFWRRRTTVIPYYRIQTVANRRSIFQRRLGLASLVVDTASSRTFFWATPTIYDLDLETARGVHEEARERLQASLEEHRRSDDDSGVSVAFT